MTDKTSTSDRRRAIGACILLMLLLVGGAIGTWIYGSIRQLRAVEILIKSIGNKPHLHESSTLYHGDGGHVHYDVDDESLDPIVGPCPGPAWLREWFGIDFVASVRSAQVFHLDQQSLPALAELTGLRCLEIVGIDPDTPLDQLIDALTRFGALESLSIPGEPFGDELLFVLPRLARLRMLRIGGNYRLTDAGLEYVCQVGGLESFELDGDSEITTEGFARLSRLKSLKSLSISLTLDGPADDTCLEKLQVLRLRKLDIGYGNASAGAGGLKFLNGFAELKTLILWNPTDSCFPADTGATKIEELVMTQCQQLTSTGLKNLKSFSGVEFLHLSNVPGLDDEALAQIAQLPKLRRLVINGGVPRLSDAGLEALIHAPNLRGLWLMGCPNLTDEGLVHLAKLKNLELLWIGYDKPDRFTPKAIDDLRSRLPKCHVHYEPAGPLIFFSGMYQLDEPDAP